MTGIVVTGHGKFPEGILSAISLVAEKPDNTAAVNFEMGQSSEDLKGSMTRAMESLEGDEVLILADLVGGTPFNTAAALKTERADKKIKIIVGVNMAALVEAVLSRAIYGLDELATALLTAGKEGLRDLDALDNAEEAPEFEDGLQERITRANYKSKLSGRIATASADTAAYAAKGSIKKSDGSAIRFYLRKGQGLRT